VSVYFLNPGDIEPSRPHPPVAPRYRAWFGRPVRDVLLVEIMAAAGLLVVFLSFLLVVSYLPMSYRVLAVCTPTIALFVVLSATTRLANAAHGSPPAAVRGFRTLARRTVVLHYDPAMEPLDAAVAALVCERELADLERAFGFRLRYWRFRRPRAYLFRVAEELTALRGHPVGGFAMGQIGGIVLWTGWTMAEAFRHEFAHLFAAKANLAWRSEVVEEGLAVWAQRTHQGHAVHAAARKWLTRAVIAKEALPVRWEFKADPLTERNYVMAGSFAGYLIGRFGWPAYWRFCRRVTGGEPEFRRRFRRHFGLSFGAARDDWFAKLREGKLNGRPGRDSFVPT
jgi:hypothetical protein